VTEQLGRREASKRATRSAIREAASQLFARQGYEATTVRQIAGTAGITERTYYRYFDGKEGLLAEQALQRIEVLCDAIRNRPAQESPLTAVEHAMLEFAGWFDADAARSPTWLFTPEPEALEILQRSTPRPLLRFEQSIAAAVLERSDGSDHAALIAQLAARVAVAVLRTAAIRRRELLADGHAVGPEVTPVLRAAFDGLRELVRTGA
jgi:AcrR family transcriptional regulator